MSHGCLLDCLDNPKWTKYFNAITLKLVKWVVLSNFKSFREVYHVLLMEALPDKLFSHNL